MNSRLSHSVSCYTSAFLVIHSRFNTGCNQHRYTVCFADSADCFHNTNRFADFAAAA